MKKSSLKYANFTCNAGSNTFVVGGMTNAKNLHEELTMAQQAYIPELKEDLKKYVGAIYVPEKAGTFSIALQLIKAGPEARREAFFMHYKMTLQAKSWRDYYLNQCRDCTVPSLIFYLRKESKVWQDRWERTRELAILTMASVTPCQFAPAPNVTETDPGSPVTSGVKRKMRIQSDVEDN